MYDIIQHTGTLATWSPGPCQKTPIIRTDSPNFYNMGLQALRLRAIEAHPIGYTVTGMWWQVRGHIHKTINIRWQLWRIKMGEGNIWRTVTCIVHFWTHDSSHETLLASCQECAQMTMLLVFASVECGASDHPNFGSQCRLMSEGQRPQPKCRSLSVGL